ncbi:hypothetical protein HanXRQr2_Chr07g0301551 [Helianthus annuus]|uniref:Uncharacterized protein n=1 Tax=Helianthus annuus TaxID=4232 RepID=A0A9K3NGS5_HELAN|nr:hypothetical protein HanXRQr2_Chr07g0301551 [Helianthus annuus]KAJ0905259.1 hypothetical protein HanPSC8_Chr07g0291921 [Helianthus annuus]
MFGCNHLWWLTFVIVQIDRIVVVCVIVSHHRKLDWLLCNRFKVGILFRNFWPDF